MVAILRGLERTGQLEKESIKNEDFNKSLQCKHLLQILGQLKIRKGRTPTLDLMKPEVRLQAG